MNAPFHSTRPLQVEFSITEEGYELRTTNNAYVGMIDFMIRANATWMPSEDVWEWDDFRIYVGVDYDERLPSCGDQQSPSCWEEHIFRMIKKDKRVWQRLEDEADAYACIHGLY